MKTPVVSAWIPGLILIMAWLPGGWAQKKTNPPSSPAPEPAPLVTPSPVTPAETAPLFPAITTAKDPSLPAHLSESKALVIKRQPPKIRLSPWTSEIVKLAESGVESSVILSFIENSGTFNLGANQIVYLHDLGLSSEIITAMLRHDQEIVSGLRPLTITSEPDWELPFDSILSVRHGDSSKVLPAPPKIEPSSVPTPNALPGVSSPAAAQFAAMQPSAPDNLVSLNQGVFGQRRASEKGTSHYRVREPYPEEITAPIILIGESRTPNTMIVVGFPRSAP